MRPTDRLGTFSRTSGGIELEGGAAAVGPVMGGEVLDADVDGTVGDEMGEAAVVVVEEEAAALVAQRPCGVKVRRRMQAIKVR